MGENLMVGSHKVSTPEFVERYEFMVWDSDTKNTKREKRRKQTLASKQAQRNADR